MASLEKWREPFEAKYSWWFYLPDVAPDAFDSPSESVDKVSRLGLAADCPANGLDTLKNLLKSVWR